MTEKGVEVEKKIEKKVEEEKEKEEPLFTERDIKNYKSNETFKFKEDEINESTNYNNIIVIDNLPIVQRAKEKKLSLLLTKILIKKCVKVKKILNIYMPYVNDNKSKGFAFIELENSDCAKEACVALKDFKIEKTRKFIVYPISQLSQIQKSYKQMRQEEREQNQETAIFENEYSQKDRLNTFLSDKYGRSQFSIRVNCDVEVYWNDDLSGSEVPLSQVLKRKNMTEDQIMWSPSGNYLVTWHEKGIALWGGENFTNQMLFNVSRPQLIDFSPDEKYLVTSNAVPRNNIVFWDVRTGMKIKSFSVDPNLLSGWPYFQWSFDSKYFGRIIGEKIEIYETKNFKLHNKPLIVKGIQNFSFSPSRNYFSYWVKSIGSVPARFEVAEISTYKSIISQNFFDVKSMGFIWSKDYLVCKVDRINQGKEKSSFVLVSFLQKKVTSHIFEMDDACDSFAWEPRGTRFAIIHSKKEKEKEKESFMENYVSSKKKSLSFYKMNPQTGGCKLIKTFQDRNIDLILWSNLGRFLCLINSQNTNISSDIEFWDVGEAKDKKTPELIGIGEHVGMTDLQWDPSGRYCVSYVSANTKSYDHGYIIWNCIGRKVDEHKINNLHQFQWRNRPKRLISQERIKQIRKNLNKKKKKYVEEEKKEDQSIQLKRNKEKKKMWYQFRDFEEELSFDYEKMKKSFEENNNIIVHDEDDLFEEKEVIEEEVIEEIVEENFE